jgi:hypothetical protein
MSNKRFDNRRKKGGKWFQLQARVKLASLALYSKMRVIIEKGLNHVKQKENRKP